MKHKCTVCDKVIKPMAIVQGGRFYYECDWCLEEVCSDCSDYDDDMGLRKCMDCLEQADIDERNGRQARPPIIGIK